MKLIKMVPALIVLGLSGCATDFKNYTNELQTYKVTLAPKFYKNTPECVALRNWNSQVQCSKKIFDIASGNMRPDKDVKDVLVTFGEVERIGTKYFVSSYDRKGVNKISEEYNVDIKRKAKFKLKATPINENNRSLLKADYHYTQDDINLDYSDSSTFEPNQFKIINVSYLHDEDAFVVQALKLQ